MVIEELGGKNILYKVDYDSMKKDHSDKSSDLKQTFEQLKVVNHKRHEYTERYKVQVQENKDLDQSNREHQDMIFKLNRELLILKKEYEKYQDAAETKEKKMSAEIHTLKTVLAEYKKEL
jgi:chromosome segregation ATPase